MAFLPWPLLRPRILTIFALITIQAVNGDREACARLCGKYMENPPVRPVDRFTVNGRAGRGRWSPETSGPRWAPQTSGNRPSRWKPSLSASPNSGLAGRSFRPSQLESVDGVPVSSLGGGPAYNAAPGGYTPSSSFPSWQSSSSWHSSSGPSWQSRPSSSSGSLGDSWGGDTSHGSIRRRWDKKTASDEHPLQIPLKKEWWLNPPRYPKDESMDTMDMMSSTPSPSPSSPHLPASSPNRPRPPTACTTLLCPLDRPKSSGGAGPIGHSNIVGQASNVLKQFFGG